MHFAVKKVNKKCSRQCTTMGVSNALTRAFHCCYCVGGGGVSTMGRLVPNFGKGGGKHWDSGDSVWSSVFLTLLVGGGYQLLRMYVYRIPVKLDQNAFRFATEVGFQPVEKAEHQGCCGRILPEQIPPESGRNRNPALDSSPPKNQWKQECAT